MQQVLERSSRLRRLGSHHRPAPTSTGGGCRADRNGVAAAGGDGATLSAVATHRLFPGDGFGVPAADELRRLRRAAAGLLGVYVVGRACTHIKETVSERREAMNPRAEHTYTRSVAVDSPSRSRCRECAGTGSLAGSS